MSNPILGQAFVLIRADTSAFARELTTQVDTAVTGVEKSAGSLGRLASIGATVTKTLAVGFAAVGLASIDLRRGRVIWSMSPTYPARTPLLLCRLSVAQYLAMTPRGHVYDAPGLLAQDFLPTGSR